MKIKVLIVPVLFIFSLFPGYGFAGDKVVVIPLMDSSSNSAPGSDGQILYNDNGKIAGAEIYYDDEEKTSSPKLRVKSRLGVQSSNGWHFAIKEGLSDPDEYLFSIDLDSGSGTVATNNIARINRNYFLFYDDVFLSYDLTIGSTLSNTSFLDLRGYTKLASYNSAPVACTESMRGTIVMNDEYELCVCRPVALGSGFKLVRDPNLNCW